MRSQCSVLNFTLLSVFFKIQNERLANEMTKAYITLSNTYVNDEESSYTWLNLGSIIAGLGDVAG